MALSYGAGQRQNHGWGMDDRIKSETGTVVEIPRTPGERHQGYWLRMVRPLFWWLLIFLILLGIHQHRIWIERTRIYFSTTINHTNAFYGAIAKLDNQPIMDGQNIPLGSHIFSIEHPKMVFFSTNLFVWYGRNDFGLIDLKRATGVLKVKAEPMAQTITIMGPEFSTTLSNMAEATVTVPTDQYTVTAKYPHWSQSQNAMIYENSTIACSFAPKFGALHLTCNHDVATYMLQNEQGEKVDNEVLPATVTDLPLGKYQAVISYHRLRSTKSVTIEVNLTNEVATKFTVGSLRLESVPAGANVNAPNGDYLGQTPLDLSDLTPGTMRFNLSLEGYEPVTLAADIVANTTNTITTNLLSIRYHQALREGTENANAGNYPAALNAAKEALSIRPNDPEALELQAKSVGQLEAARQQTAVNEQKQIEQRQLAETARRQAEAAARAEKERTAQLNAPHEYFARLMEGVPGASDSIEQRLTAHGNVSDLRNKIADALSKSLLLKFTIEQNDEPFTNGFVIRAKQTMPEGYCRCYIVGGLMPDGEITIIYKVLEYVWPSDLALTALLNRPSDDKALPLDQSTLSPLIKESRRRLGSQIVTERIQQAISSRVH